MPRFDLLRDIRRISSTLQIAPSAARSEDAPNLPPSVASLREDRLAHVKDELLKHVCVEESPSVREDPCVARIAPHVRVNPLKMARSVQSKAAPQKGRAKGRHKAAMVRKRSIKMTYRLGEAKARGAAIPGMMGKVASGCGDAVIGKSSTETKSLVCFDSRAKVATNPEAAARSDSDTLGLRTPFSKTPSEVLLSPTIPGDGISESRRSRFEAASKRRRATGIAPEVGGVRRKVVARGADDEECCELKEDAETNEPLVMNKNGSEHDSICSSDSEAVARSDCEGSGAATRYAELLPDVRLSLPPAEEGAVRREFETAKKRTQIAELEGRGGSQSAHLTGEAIDLGTSARLLSKPEGSGSAQKDRSQLSQLNARTFKPIELSNPVLRTGAISQKRPRISSSMLPTPVPLGFARFASKNATSKHSFPSLPTAKRATGGSTGAALSTCPHLAQDNRMRVNEPDLLLIPQPTRVGGGSGEDSTNPSATTDGEADEQKPAVVAKTERIVRDGDHPRRRRSLRLAAGRNFGAVVVDLTQPNDSDDSDAEKELRAGAVGPETTPELVRDYLSRCDAERRLLLMERPRHGFLKSLSDDEVELVRYLTTGRDENERLASIAAARITLTRSDFKRLRGARWLNDELINAYVALINERNDLIFSEVPEDLRRDVPRTFVFNTFFHTRLTSNGRGYDYDGVARWTSRAKVDVRAYDQLLVPVNLGNHHWVLAGIEVATGVFRYLDSMSGQKSKFVLDPLMWWLRDELREKHEEEADISCWKIVTNRYRILRKGTWQLSDGLDFHARTARMPQQGDGGSCGVFTAKTADCLSLGIKIYFMQHDISLVRNRMALELCRGYVSI